MKPELRLSVTLRGIVAESYEDAEEQAREILVKISDAVDSDVYLTKAAVRAARETNGTYMVTTR